MSNQQYFDRNLRDVPELISGRATSLATLEATDKPGNIHEKNRRQLGNLGLSVTSIGLGTGQFPLTNEPAVIQRSAEVVKAALLGGINLIDCASNYSHGTAEMIVGSVLDELINEHALNRSGIVVCSKGGYVEVNGEKLNNNLIEYEHSLDPETLRQQLDESRKHLQLDTIDIYCLHNPEEYLLKHGWNGFERCVLRAFEYLEIAVGEGKIGSYGVASAEGFRIMGPCYHSLDVFLRLAEVAGGRSHHFTTVQLPFSLSQSEALCSVNEIVNQGKVSFLEAANAHGLAVIGSAALNGMYLPPQALTKISGLCPALNKPAQTALCFSHSAPGIDSALFGTQQPEHVDTALAVLASPPMVFDAINKVLEA